MFSIKNKFSTFCTLSSRQKCWFLILLLYSGLLRFCLLFLPFHLLSSILGKQFSNLQCCSVIKDNQLHYLPEIGQITRLVERYSPWESKCLIQAMLAASLYRYYQIPYVIYLGVLKQNDSKELLKAHAWSLVGDKIITGAKGHKKFTIINTYISPLINH
ncbi:conserved hypothetical protein [Psychromonas ingrahamii 37]|uniref:Microcin J25-processing protein McjB C-terminal domain-containing protein n=1 Tax=Psychromonas ingrahamii (strain DSM 17664 / CCUG 51855 / 37) TaxID=357804 RepID=A1SY12_PSYIN|nr:conserved hypothetical protein [Psychromonas ingrahamii 37]